MSAPDERPLLAVPPAADGSSRFGWPGLEERDLARVAAATRRPSSLLSQGQRWVVAVRWRPRPASGRPMARSIAPLTSEN